MNATTPVPDSSNAQLRLIAETIPEVLFVIDAEKGVVAYISLAVDSCVAAGCVGDGSVPVPSVAASENGASHGCDYRFAGYRTFFGCESSSRVFHAIALPGRRTRFTASYVGYMW